MPQAALTASWPLPMINAARDHAAAIKAHEFVFENARREASNETLRDIARACGFFEAPAFSGAAFFDFLPRCAV